MRIEVTQEDIDNGLRGNCRQCPIALVVARSTGALYVSVNSGIQWSYFRGCVSPEHWRRIPLEVFRFMSDFDRGRPVEPFSFEL
jgi:hypothetical protein